MNAAVLHFVPSAELAPHDNLRAFVEMCKQSEVLSARRQFESDTWSLPGLKGRNYSHQVAFRQLADERLEEFGAPLPQPFRDFAKAALVYLHDKRPVVSQSVRLSALRCLDVALRARNKGSRPTAVDDEVLGTAMEHARQTLTPGVAYRVGGQLELIAEMMRSKGIIRLRQKWLHGMRKPQELGSRIGKAAIAARQEKLPSAAALRALAGIFQSAVEPVDVVVSSLTALLLCAPERINEVLRLKRNCLVEGDGRFSGRLGLRWAGSKLAEDTTKWLPSQMIPVAREAVANVLKATAPAQELAAWYSHNPKALFLHPGAAHLRAQEVLTKSDIGLILWGDESARDQAAEWAATTKKLTGVPLGGRQLGYRFVDVERAVLSMLPATFPNMPGDPDLRCEDAMALIRTNESHAGKATYLCMFDCIDYTRITSHLASRADRKNIFERFGYTEDDGAPISLRSHSLRHYLNMLAQMGGLSSAEIAIFSGRKDERQNRAYDHMSSDEVQAPISEALKAGFTGALVSGVARDLMTRDEFKSKGAGAAHTTEFGWCLHNFASEPCQMHRDCINCEEQVCVKGEARKEANLRRLKEETEYLLGQAREALNDEEYGADNWVKHQAQTLERVTTLLSIMDDAAVPAGAQVRLDFANAPLITNYTVQPRKFIRARRQKALK